jgi:glycosyltransferase involved in cell wall biosynthesis
MNIVFFGHPAHSKFRSMDSFTEMLSTGMKERGHNVQVWIPKQVLSKFNIPLFFRKWLGYFDQFVIFPLVAKRTVSANGEDTLFVFTDQALGPWVPLVADKTHVIHCHDFLALKSAEGEIAENTTSLTGRLYQSYIKKGYQSGKNFISVSSKTNSDLNRYLSKTAASQYVVYNGLKPTFQILDQSIAREFISKETNACVSNGYIIHVGGNQWYKNRKGVVEIYNAFRQLSPMKIPLMLIGDQPSEDLLAVINRSKYKADIYSFSDRNDQFIQNAYAGASALLFPSLAEGFGWPIAEAMACGTLVVTTGQAPMTEVGGSAAYYIERQPSTHEQTKVWAMECAKVLQKVICLSRDERNKSIEAGMVNSARFNLVDCLNKIESIYINVCAGALR